MCGKTWTINYAVDGRRVREAIGGSKKLADMVLKKRATDAIENRWFNKRNVGPHAVRRIRRHLH
jgi:hypothetical protein